MHKKKHKRHYKQPNRKKKKAQKALARAAEMQTKVETAMFDKAVKECNKKWKGYANYRWDAFEKITGIKILKTKLNQIPDNIL